MPKRPPTLTRRADRQEQHQDAKIRDRWRGNSTARGYGHRWRRAAKTYLASADNLFCRRCETALATLVDHITPIQGADDPLFWEQSNWQPLCRRCHAIKTGEDKTTGNTRKIP